MGFFSNPHVSKNVTELLCDDMIIICMMRGGLSEKHLIQLFTHYTHVWTEWVTETYLSFKGSVKCIWKLRLKHLNVTNANKLVVFEKCLCVFFFVVFWLFQQSGCLWTVMCSVKIKEKAVLTSNHKTSLFIWHHSAVK